MAKNVFGSMSPGKTGDLTAYEPSLREQIAWAAANMFGNTRYGKQDIANKVGGGLDIVPGVGDVVGFNDAKRSFDRGAYGKAAAEAGTSLIGLIPGGGDLAAGAAKAIFGGMAAKTADRVMLSKAEEMAKSGADKAKIWDATGWFKGPDDKWRFEIDDNGAKFRPRAAEGFENAAVGDLAFRHNADGMMSHIPLHQAYDDLWKVDTTLTKGGGYPYQGGAQYQVRDSGKEEILLNAGSLDEAKSLNLHELQHAIQQREGFSGGGSPGVIGANALGPTPDADLLSQADQIKYLGEQWPGGLDGYIKAFPTAMPDGTPYHAAAVSLAAKPDELKRLWTIHNVNTDPVLGYHHIAGEVEARNVEKRMNMTPEQRRATPPWATQDVPDELQIIRRK